MVKEFIFLLSVVTYIIAAIYQAFKVVRLFETRADRVEISLNIIVLTVVLTHYSLLYPIGRRLSAFQFFALPSLWQAVLVGSSGLAFFIVIVLLPLSRRKAKTW